MQCSPNDVYDGQFEPDRYAGLELLTHAPDGEASPLIPIQLQDLDGACLWGHKHAFAGADPCIVGQLTFDF